MSVNSDPRISLNQIVPNTSEHSSLHQLKSQCFLGKSDTQWFVIFKGNSDAAYAHLKPFEKAACVLCTASLVAAVGGLALAIYGILNQSTGFILSGTCVFAVGLVTGSCLIVRMDNAHRKAQANLSNGV